MGLFGWNVLSDTVVTLRGVVRGHSYSGDDGDWSLDVEPDPEFQHLLINSHGIKNADGQVECEIRPTGKIGNEDHATALFAPLVGKTVTVQGIWVEDKSHDDKTEIHPVMSILRDDADALAEVRRFEYFAFSHDTSFFNLLPMPSPPFAGTSKHSAFQVALGSSPLDDPGATFQVRSEENLSDSRGFSTTQDGDQRLVIGHIVTGTAPDQGFYHGVVDALYDTSTPMLFAAVYQPGTGAQFVRVRDRAGFEKEQTDMFNQGLRTTSVQRFVLNNQEQFLAVYRPGTGAEWFRIRDKTGFVKEQQDMFNQGLRITCVQRFVANGQEQLLAVYRPGAGAQEVKIRDRAGFDKEQVDMFNQGLRISSLQRFVVGGQEQFLAVYQPGTGVQWFRVRDGAAFEKEHTDMFNQGLRIRSLQRFSISRHAMWMAVYRPGAGAEWQSVRNQAGFDDEALKMFKQGLRIACLHATHDVKVEPLECDGLRQQIAETEKQLEVVGKDIQDDLKKGNKPSGANKAEELKLEKALSELRTKAASLGCFPDSIADEEKPA